MRFLCDRMLASLGRWLRIAGYDTLIVDSDIEDSQILDTALKEKRRLLTRDRHFSESSPKDSVLFLKGNSIEEWVKELNAALPMNWLHSPFSRCLLCNGALSVPDETLIQEMAPEAVRSQTKEFWACEQCHKLYWEGSHTKQMRQQLELWQESKGQ